MKLRQRYNIGKEHFDLNFYEGETHDSYEKSLIWEKLTVTSTFSICLRGKLLVEIFISGKILIFNNTRIVFRTSDVF